MAGSIGIYGLLGVQGARHSSHSLSPFQMDRGDIW